MALTELISVLNPKSPISEAYRTLRTNIQFSGLDRELKTIVITSSTPGEGKTTTICNLAVTMAQSGGKILLIDCDMRKSQVHRLFGFSSNHGLTNLLAQHISQEDAIKQTTVLGLDILPAGPKPPNPSELIGSKAMKELLQKLAKEYDRILIDAPPVGLVTDAAILSTITDGTILVVASEQSNIEVTQRAKEHLLNVNANIIGVVVNKIPTHGRGYFGKYYYYTYYMEEDEDEGDVVSTKGKRRKR